MGILESAIPVGVICTKDLVRATAFYRDTLGLKLAAEDNFAAIFDISGVALRVSTVPDWTAHQHAVFGFKVADVTQTVKALREKGVTFNTYEGFTHDELGIITIPGTSSQVAWFKDLDGNVLSVTNASAPARRK
jgi:catechol 2,3-dioxygenase-like lactoylglutathione lyase family enzyme